MRIERILLMSVIACLGMNAGWSQVTSERLLKAGQEPENWLTYSGDYSGKRYSTLNQINTGNVQELTMQWVFQTQEKGNFETTPLVFDSVMYITGPNDVAFALDARTGRVIWRYRRVLPEKLEVCCGRVNRGFAVLGERLFLATLDAHVVALDAKTGSVLWDVEAEDYRKGYSFTLAPLAIQDKILVGVSGGEYGIRGFIDAYETATGKRAWRFYTIPGPGELGHETWKGDSWKTGGGPSWLTGTYDPELNLTFLGIGNPAPDAYGADRQGDNLFTDSVVALNPETGKLKWYFQFTPHDLHDWDASQVPVLLDLDYDGKLRKTLALANRNGFFYLLDRTNGKLLLARPFAQVTWAKMDDDGRPVALPESHPTENGSHVCPAPFGATNYMSPSFSPQTSLFYVSAREECAIVSSYPQTYQEGINFWASAYQPVEGKHGWGAVRAINPRTGKIEWEFKYYSAPWSGVLSTAGGLVFSGDMEGYLIALDARTGKDLWHVQTGGSIWAAPMTYALDGKQYVVIPAGNDLFTFALPDRIVAGEPARKP